MIEAGVGGIAQFDFKPLQCGQALVRHGVACATEVTCILRALAIRVHPPYEGVDVCTTPGASCGALLSTVDQWDR